MEGRVWIADRAADKLICLDKDGNFIGSYGHSGTLDDKSGSGFSFPTGLAAIGDSLYVADAGNQRIIKLKIKQRKPGHE